MTSVFVRQTVQTLDLKEILKGFLPNDTTDYIIEYPQCPYCEPKPDIHQISQTQFIFSNFMSCKRCFHHHPMIFLVLGVVVLGVVYLARKTVTAFVPQMTPINPLAQGILNTFPGRDKHQQQ